jgi:plastocyanin
MHGMRIARLAAIAFIALAPHADAAQYEVVQLNKAFSTLYLKVKVGDTVSFVNKDPYFHNIFSLSESNSFDLGSHGPGERRSVTFDKPGKVFVECAIHPFMKMQIDVLP